MALPLYFEPEEDMPEAAEQGTGWLTYDDGRRIFIDSDPELAAMASGPPPAKRVQMPPAIMPGDAYAMPPIEMDPGPPLKLPELAQPSLPGDPSTGIPSSGDPYSPAISPEATAAAQEVMGIKSKPAPAPAPEPSTAAAGGGDSDWSSISPEASQLARESMGMRDDGSDGLVLAQRTGRLDPEVAARQAEERVDQNKRSLDTTLESRNAQWAIERRAQMEERGRIRAQLDEQQRIAEEGQAKLNRWRKEQRDVADTKIASDLVSASGGGALGGLSAALHVLGAALLGYTGSDAGLRMIENKIDRHVKTEMSKRDSKLRILADQIGSEEQAVAMAKVEYRKALEERAVAMQRLTKADAFMAQTPAVLEAMRSANLKDEQAAERESMGKNIEMLPKPGPGIDRDTMIKYGALRRERQGTQDVVERGAKELGLIWQPGKNGSPGSFVNKKEVLARGIGGKGNLESWVPDFVYRTLGGITAEGYQVRGAAEAMSFALARQAQPVGVISNDDVKRIAKSAALDTEEGMINALERMQTGIDDAARHDVPQFGADIVQEYERSLGQRGGRGAPQGQVGAGRPATLEDLNQPQAKAEPRGLQRRL